EEEATGRPEFSELLLDEHAVGAQVNVLASLQNAADQPADFRINHRLAAADTHDRRAALIHRGENFLDAQFLLNGFRVFANPPAASAGEIASVQRLQHEHEWETLFASDFLLGDVAGHRRGQR